MGRSRRLPGPAAAAARHWTCAWSACPRKQWARSRLRPAGSPRSGAPAGTLNQAPDGTPYPVRGSLQLVFCDLGTPGPAWNAYDELRDLLTARGMPREAIRFIHEARTDRDKAPLFAACRNGSVAVLIGSTERMGVGTNVQFAYLGESLVRLVSVPSSPQLLLAQQIWTELDAIRHGNPVAVTSDREHT